METTYRVTEKGQLLRADSRLARAERAIERSYIDVRSRFEAAEAAEEALALVAETRKLLAELRRDSKWSTARDTRERVKEASSPPNDEEELRGRDGRDRRGR
jgi:hypothetical protein